MPQRRPGRTRGKPWSLWIVASAPGFASNPKGNIMTQTNIIGIVVLSVGVVLLFFAWRATQAPIEQVSEALTGRFTGNTMAYLVGGIIGVLAGAGLLYRGSVQS